MLKDAQIVSEMVKCYGLSSTRLTWFDSLYATKVAARFESGGRLYKLKRFSGKRDSLETIAHRHLWLQKQVGSLLPTWRTTMAGRLYMEVADELYYVTEWVEGRPFDHTVRDARSLGAVLSRVHAFQPHTQYFHAPRLWHRLRTVVQAKRILSNGVVRELPDPMRSFLRKEQQTLRRQMDVTVKRLRVLATKLQPAVLHGDVTIPNLLYDKNGARLIDWETVDGGFAAEELAKTALNTCNLSIELVESLLNGYGWLQLSPENRAAFLYFLHIPREVVYLLHKAEKRSPNEQDRAQWQLVMQNWRDRQLLLNRYPLDMAY